VCGRPACGRARRGALCCAARAGAAPATAGPPPPPPPAPGPPLPPSRWFRRAGERGPAASDGPGSFQTAFLDALWNTDADDVASSTIWEA